MPCGKWTHSCSKGTFRLLPAGIKCPSLKKSPVLNIKHAQTSLLMILGALTIRGHDSKIWSCFLLCSGFVTTWGKFWSPSMASTHLLPSTWRTWRWTIPTQSLSDSRSFFGLLYLVVETSKEHIWTLLCTHMQLDLYMLWFFVVQKGLLGYIWAFFPMHGRVHGFFKCCCRWWNWLASWAGSIQPTSILHA